ncbi:protein sel-1 homolog 1-like isoform X2 [Bolinopsis microptera]|uniref:protein sel-1 homolog 1-like isoform X2 n=1 Tax=Bolinopsis microptera TaxID=2820187 RepID=UPI00307A8942
MRNNKDGGLRIIFLLSVLLFCISHVRSEGADDELEPKQNYLVDPPSENTPDEKLSSETEEELTDRILEEILEKNSEIVEETSVFKDVQPVSENNENVEEPPILEDDETVSKDNENVAEPPVVKNEIPIVGREKKLLSDIVKNARQTVQDVVDEAFDPKRAPKENYNGVEGSYKGSFDSDDQHAPASATFDMHGNPVYEETPSSSPPIDDDYMNELPDEDDELDYDEDDEDDFKTDETTVKSPDEDEMGLKGMPVPESGQTEEAMNMPDRPKRVPKSLQHATFENYNEVDEVPAPPVEEKEVPGSEEVEEAEEILGLRQTGVRQETLDGVVHKPNYRKAYALLQTASSKGNNKAKVLLGFAHLTGDHEPYVSHNTSLAFEMFEKAAKSGLPSAQRALAIMHSSGIQADSSQSKALLYYTFAALGGDSIAQMALAFRYWSGISVAQSCESALKYYRLVADNVARKVGSAGSQVVLRIRLMEEEESPQNSPILDEDLVQYYQFLADKGDLQAQLGLGQLYLQGGRGIERNIKLAQNYFSAAAKSGNTNAYGYMGKISMQLKEYDVALKYYKLATKDPMGQWGMGTLYYNGWGVDQDYSQALSYFTLASQQGHTEAELQLGLMHLSGIGVKKDHGIALKHFNVASKSGHVLAFYNLGMMHAMGIGVMRNCQTSAELLKNVAERGTWGNELMDAHALYHKGYVDSALIKYLILAEQGYEVAQANVAFILDKDDTDFIRNLKSRYKRAFINWKRAAAQGFGGARLKLGDYYYYGQGTEPNPVEAAEQYQIASDVDHNPQAMFNLGYMHELGIGRTQDMHLAKRYYDMAASASVDAHVPTMLANAKLMTKLHIEWLIQFYQEFTFTMLYDSILVWYTSWAVYFTENVEGLTQFFVQLDESATEDWDIYLMSVLAIVLGLVMALRGHNVRAAQLRAQQNVPQQPPNQ